MKQKIIEIAAPFKGNKGFTAAWLGLAAVLFCTVFMAPLFIGWLVSYIARSEEVTTNIAVFCMIWMFGVLILCMVYGVRTFHVRLSLFKKAGDTAKLGILGLFNVIEGGSVGILLIVPSLFFLCFKLYYAALIGYIFLMLSLSRFILTHTIPCLKKAKEQ